MSVRPLTLDADGLPLSALAAEPAGAPRALVLAVHGRGMRAAYFAGPADPATSLLAHGARHGHTVLAVDRPGHGASAAALPAGAPIADQGAALAAALADYARTRPVGDGVLLLAHSFGGKIALHLAAHWPDHLPPLLGVDVSGLAQHYAPGVWDRPDTLAAGTARLTWGPLHLYPPGTFHAARRLLTPVPALENRELATWPARFTRLAARIRVPVRLTFADHEAWWQLGDDRTLAAAFPSATVHHHPHAGHNLSLARTAPAYHHAALTFADRHLPTAPQPA
ncbi:alpha/beta hydrolase [Kitasatospora sp. NPDC052868]|uniref:alpha/beta hydrolase n=1 Tax=Kitasatospora sp. NPDC052868 TaxID=3364060 RepID=UPI0037C7FF2B